MHMVHAGSNFDATAAVVMATSSKKAIPMSPNRDLIFLDNSSSSENEEECSIVRIEPKVTNKSKKCVRFNLEPQECIPRNIPRPLASIPRPLLSAPTPPSSTGSANGNGSKHKEAISSRGGASTPRPLLSAPTPPSSTGSANGNGSKHKEAISSRGGASTPRPLLSAPTPPSSTNGKGDKRKETISPRGGAHKHLLPKGSSPSRVQTARKSTGVHPSNCVHLQKLKQKLKKFELKVSKMNVAIPSGAQMPPTLTVKRKERNTSGSDSEHPPRKRMKVSETSRTSQLSTKRVQDTSGHTAKVKEVLKKHLSKKNSVQSESLAHVANSKSKDVLQKYLLYKQSLEEPGKKSIQKPNESLAKSSSANKQNKILASEHVRNKLQVSTKHDTESCSSGSRTMAGQSSKQAGESLTQSMSRSRVSRTTGWEQNKSFAETVQNSKQLSEIHTMRGQESRAQTSMQMSEPCAKSSDQPVKSPQIQSSSSKLERFINKRLNRDVKPSSLLKQIHSRTSASKDGLIQKRTDACKRHARGTFGHKNAARRSVHRTAGKQSMKPDGGNTFHSGGSVAPSPLGSKQPVRILSFVDAVSFSSSCDSSLDEADAFPFGSPKSSAPQTSEHTNKKAEIHLAKRKFSAQFQNSTGGTQSLLGLGSSANSMLVSASHSHNSMLDTGAHSQNAMLDSGAHSQNSVLDPGAHSQNSMLDSGAHSQNSMLLDTGAHSKNSMLVSGAHSQNSMLDPGAHSQNSMLDSGAHSQNSMLDCAHSQISTLDSGAHSQNSTLDSGAQSQNSMSLDQDSGSWSHADSEYEKKLQDTISKVIAFSETKRSVSERLRT